MSIDDDHSGTIDLQELMEAFMELKKQFNIDVSEGNELNIKKMLTLTSDEYTMMEQKNIIDNITEQKI